MAAFTKGTQQTEVTDMETTAEYLSYLLSGSWLCKPTRDPEPGGWARNNEKVRRPLLWDR